jgi:hypothetical protein
MGKGTGFEVLLPITRDRSDAGENPQFQVMDGSERILRIDDESDILFSAMSCPRKGLPPWVYKVF